MFEKKTSDTREIDRCLYEYEILNMLTNPLCVDSRIKFEIETALNEIYTGSDEAELIEVI